MHPRYLFVLRGGCWKTDRRRWSWHKRHLPEAQGWSDDPYVGYGFRCALMGRQPRIA